eukprot:g11677.t1
MLHTDAMHVEGMSTVPLKTCCLMGRMRNHVPQSGLWGEWKRKSAGGRRRREDPPQIKGRDDVNPHIKGRFHFCLFRKGKNGNYLFRKEKIAKAGVWLAGNRRSRGSKSRRR